ncbi:MAG: hypothetical protein FWC16_10430 [Defluviitaleaceae bacterium]|nr:hypothetical protein [Defluviitaleaceae bacterium]MCL2275332.1 hypothetical protein [Defluviitaleaceae bacterium]
MGNLSQYTKNIMYLKIKEETFENLAHKLGCDTSVLSKNVSPKKVSLKFLDRISNAYDFDYADVLFGYLEYMDKPMLDIYYAYFLGDAPAGKLRMNVAEIKTKKNKIDFTIKLKHVPSKVLNGKIMITDNVIYFNMHGEDAGLPYQGYITLPYGKKVKEYVGGVGFMMLPVEAQTLPCVQKVVISSKELDLTNKETGDYQFLAKVLKLESENTYLQIASKDQDSEVYKHIMDLKYK